MSEKRYQVFVSSTFVDLKDERAAVVQTLMEMDCIPAGMESFPAVDEEQLRFIKRVIDDCDYYVLIIGGRYGSVDEEGVSYTQREYEYAIEKEIPVLAFIKRDISDLALSKTEATTPSKMEQLAAFRQKAMNGRMVKLWDDHSELPGFVALGLMKSIKLNPGVGWVRGDSVSSETLLRENHDLRAKNEELQANQVTTLEFDKTNLAGLDVEIELSGKMTVWDGYHNQYTNRDWNSSVAFKEVFKYCAPYLRLGVGHSKLNNLVAISAQAELENDLDNKELFKTTDADFHRVLIQFEALSLIETFTSKAGTARSILTDKGKKEMADMLVLRD